MFLELSSLRDEHKVRNHVVPDILSGMKYEKSWVKEVLRPLRGWAGIAKTGQDLGQEDPAGDFRGGVRMGKSLLACFIWCYREANLYYTEDLIVLKLEFSEKISLPTSWVNAISFNDVFLQSKLLYVPLRNVSLKFW